MKKYVVLDTQEILICDACKLPIAISADKVVFGVGGAVYVKVYHRECDPLGQVAVNASEFVLNRQTVPFS